MRMSQRNKRKPYRRYFFRYFPMTSWYFMRDEKEIETKSRYSKIDDFHGFDQSKELTIMVIGSAITVLAGFCFVFGLVWLLNETIKSLFLINP